MMGFDMELYMKIDILMYTPVLQWFKYAYNTLM